MRAKEYDLITRAVEDGVAYGINRLFKYHEQPHMTEEEMQEANDHLVQEVLNEICEWFTFGGTEDE